MRDNSGQVNFCIEVAPQFQLEAVMRMRWVGKENKWQYSLSVNHTDVPAYWMNSGRHTTSDEAVVVIYEVPVPAPPPSPESAAFAAVAPADEPRNTDAACLPQGVSFDSAAGTYNAT